MRKMSFEIISQVISCYLEISDDVISQVTTRRKPTMENDRHPVVI